MHGIWRDMFVITLPILEKILRPVIVYFFLVVMIIGDDNSVSGGLLGATSLLAINYLVVRFLYKHKDLEQIVEGKADVLIEGGKLRPEHLKKELITTAQLEAAARKQGFSSLGEVDQCILEPGGTLSFIGKKPDVDVLRHKELLDRIDRLKDELALLRGNRPPSVA